MSPHREEAPEAESIVIYRIERGPIRIRPLDWPIIAQITSDGGWLKIRRQTDTDTRLVYGASVITHRMIGGLVYENSWKQIWQALMVVTEHCRLTRATAQGCVDSIEPRDAG